MRVLIVYSLSLITLLGACCGEDQICPGAKLTDFSTIPYHSKEALTYENEENGDRIRIEFFNQWSMSTEKTIEGSCSILKNKVLECQPSMFLTTDSIVFDGTDSLPPLLKRVNVSVSKSEATGGKETLSVSFLGLNFIFSGGVYSDELLGVERYKLRDNYTTRFGSYSKVYERKVDLNATNPEFRRKLVIDSKGKVISFSLTSDTLDVYHLVE